MLIFEMRHLRLSLRSSPKFWASNTKTAQWKKRWMRAALFGFTSSENQELRGSEAYYVASNLAEDTFYQKKERPRICCT